MFQVSTPPPLEMTKKFTTASRLLDPVVEWLRACDWCITIGEKWPELIRLRGANFISSHGYRLSEASGTILSDRRSLCFTRERDRVRSRVALQSAFRTEE
jgi:hypothetical protein